MDEALAQKNVEAALSRARQMGSLEGVLRTAQALAALRDRDVVEDPARASHIWRGVKATPNQ
jgi:hypothetical protein